MKPIALQLYSVRDSAEADLGSTLKTVRALGYEGVELAGLYGHTPKEVARLLAESGLEPISAHVPFDDMRADFDRVISNYTDIGCKNLAVPWLKESDRPCGEGYDKTVADILRIAELAQKNGITLSYHNHDFEFVKNENGVYALDELYATVPKSLLKVELDVCWVTYAGEDAVKYISKYSDRIKLLHLKDLALLENGFEFRPVGHGIIDFKAVIDAAEGCGVEWYVVEQDEPSMGKTRLESIEMSINYIKNEVK